MSNRSIEQKTFSPWFGLEISIYKNELPIGSNILAPVCWAGELD